MCLPSAAPVTRTCPRARPTNLPVWLSTSTDSYRRRDTETYSTTYSGEHLSLWRQAAPSTLCLRECEHCVARDLALRLGIEMLMGADVPMRYVKLCILSLVFFTIYFEILLTKVFIHADWDLLNQDPRRRRRLHVINVVRRRGYQRHGGHPMVRRTSACIACCPSSGDSKSRCRSPETST